MAAGMIVAAAVKIKHPTPAPVVGMVFPALLWLVVLAARLQGLHLEQTPWLLI